MDLNWFVFLLFIIGVENIFHFGEFTLKRGFKTSLDLLFIRLCSVSLFGDLFDSISLEWRLKFFLILLFWNKLEVCHLIFDLLLDSRMGVTVKIRSGLRSAVQDGIYTLPRVSLEAMFCWRRSDRWWLLKLLLLLFNFILDQLVDLNGFFHLEIGVVSGRLRRWEDILGTLLDAIEVGKTCLILWCINLHV